MFASRAPGITKNASLLTAPEAVSQAPSWLILILQYKIPSLSAKNVSPSIYLPTVAYTLAQTQRIAGHNFWVWLRDLDIEQARLSLYGENGGAQVDAEKSFAYAVAEGKWIDPENQDGEPLRLLHEGQAGEQEMLNESHCTKCMVSLQSLCQDYP